MKNCKKFRFNRFLIMFFSLSLIIFLSFCASAQEEIKESVVNIEADNVTYDKSTDKMIFEGNVIVTQEDITLTAQEADFDVDKKIGQIKGNIKLVQSDITITGETLEAFLNDKKYIFQEKVILVQERKDKEDKEDNITWNCNNLEIFTDTQDLTATGEVKILKKDYTITAGEAVYNDKEQKITLTVKVRIEEEGGRWITGDKAFFYIDSERLEVEGTVRSGIKLD
ncbi:MAG: LPS export ABC transporter periplasmic protein LptC [Candidatus Atribacteria bacterium]|nr:LPS export ABC transporter periplasmic protein LptC [Candidatus Atribacteria bacterium]